MAPTPTRDGRSSSRTCPTSFSSSPRWSRRPKPPWPQPERRLERERACERTNKHSDQDAHGPATCASEPRGQAGLLMSIFVDDKTKVVYQGLTGSQGRFYGLLN